MTYNFSEVVLLSLWTSSDIMLSALKNCPPIPYKNIQRDFNI